MDPSKSRRQTPKGFVQDCPDTSAPQLSSQVLRTPAQLPPVSRVLEPNSPTLQDPRDDLIKQLQQIIQDLQHQTQQANSHGYWPQLPPSHQPTLPPVNSLSVPASYAFKNPFSQRLLSIVIPDQFRMPLPIEQYTGEKEPGKHLVAFGNEMLFLGVDEGVMCRMFPRTLKGDALKWFMSLPPGSVDSWADLSAAFAGHFFIFAKEAPKTLRALAQVKQKDDETLRAFLARFYKEAYMVPGLSETVKLHIVIEAIKPASSFAFSLAKMEPKTMEEFEARAAKYIRVEMDSGMIASVNTVTAAPTEEQMAEKSSSSGKEKFWPKKRRL